MKSNVVVGLLAVGALLGALVGFFLRPALVPGEGGSVRSTASEAPVASCSVGATDDELEGGLLRVGDKVFTQADLPADLRSQIYDARHQAYEQVSGLLKQFGLQYRLAVKAKGGDVDPANLPPLQELLGAVKVDEAEVKKVYEENKGRMPQGMTFEQVKGDIERFVTNQKLSEAFGKELADAEKSGAFQVLIPAPVAPEVKIDTAAFPSKGPETAEHTLVEVSDYLCPHCQKVYPEVKAALKELGPKVRFVQVNYSLRPEQLSGALVRGAYCAKKQGDDQFWAYHDAAFTLASDGKLDQAADKTGEVMKVADKVKLDKAAFKTCLDSDEAKKHVDETVTTMSANGVKGTPTFFLDNKMLDLHGTDVKTALLDAVAKTKS